MCTLAEVALDRDWVVTGVKGTGQWRKLRNANQSQVFLCAKLPSIVFHKEPLTSPDYDMFAASKMSLISQCLLKA
jgi:hypothetical protein